MRDSLAISANGHRLFRSKNASALRLLLSEARLHNAPLLLSMSDLDDEGRRWWEGLLKKESRLVDAHPIPIIFSEERALEWLHGQVTGLAQVKFGIPSTQRVAALWERELGTSIGLMKSDMLQVAETYQIPPGAVVEAARQVHQQLSYRTAEERKKPGATSSLVWNAARAQLNHRLGTMAETVTTRLTMDDVILGDQLREKVLSLLIYARRQREVFDEWGFGSRITYGRGLCVMFSGAPGTGKTLIAGILANELGRELFKVDTSQVVDKYIGETEKNLARIFDEAERAQAVLLFDEADSLFAKRTSVSSATDRYANLNVNYLLQRMERFEGMSILTTNFESSIDEAFKRRLRFSLRFPEPDVTERALLWQTLIPEAAKDRIAPDVSWNKLAHTFEMTGGYIKNAVLRAAMQAAEDGTRIEQHHLFSAAASVYAESGRIAQSRYSGSKR